jgi:hypothetical protein
MRKSKFNEHQIIDDPSDASAVLDELEVAGFPSEDVDVLTGEEGVHRIDVTGEQHGLLAALFVFSTKPVTWSLNISSATSSDRGPGTPDR